MSQISGIASLTTGQLQAVLRIQELTRAIAQNTQRLSTLKRINSAKDDPSGVVQAALLRSELTAAETASAGITQANALLSTADSTASQILTNLQQARALALDAADGTATSSEIASDQIQIDSTLRSIDTLARTEFGGQRLLDGTSAYRVAGYDNTEILDVDVLDKQTSSDVIVNINVTQQAAKATDSYTGGTLAAAATLTVTGQDGSTAISLSSGSTTQNITDAFNAVTYLTGVTATRVDASQVNFTTADYGSKAIIQIAATTGTFTTTSSGSALGTDAIATINSQQVTGDGVTFSYNSSQLSLDIEVDPTASGSLTPFTVAGSGLQFVVGTSVADRARIGMPKLTTSSLGGITGKLASIISGGANTLTGGKAAEALKIIDDAIADVTRAEAVIGGFQTYTLDSASSVLDSMISNTSDALSAVEDADVALEAAQLTNNQLLQQTAYQALSITSLNNQSVLLLLASLLT